MAPSPAAPAPTGLLPVRETVEFLIPVLVLSQADGTSVAYDSAALTVTRTAANRFDPARTVISGSGYLPRDRSLFGDRAGTRSMFRSRALADLDATNPGLADALRAALPGWDL